MANEASLPLPNDALTAAPQRRRQSVQYAVPVGASLAITALLYSARKYEISLLDVGLAFLPIFSACMLYRAWTENNKSTEKWSAAPMLLTLALAYAQTFGAGIFWSSRLVSNVDRGPYELTPTACTIALILAVVSFASLYYGTQLRVADALTVNVLPYLKEDRFTWNYLRFIMVLGIATAHMVDVALSAEGLRQVLLWFINYVPLTAFCLLFRRYLNGEGSTTDKVLLALFAANKVFAGIASGWLGSAVGFLLVVITVYISTRKRLPVAALVIVLAYVVFMQPGKMRFREQYWYGEHTGSAVERATFWVQSSAEVWGDVLSNKEGGAKVADLFSATTDRTSLIAFTAQMVEYVPTVIPYQNGSTYAFLLVSWVPRAFWPNKPSASDVNHLYQTTFRLTREENLGNVSLSPGIAGEAYWNFGWAGVVLVSLLLGIFLRFLEVQCARHNSGAFMNALIVVTTPLFLSVESHMSTYIGGLPVLFIVVLAAFAPVLTIRARQTGGAMTESAVA